MSSPQRAIELFQGYIDRTSSPEEEQELFNWLSQSDKEGNLDEAFKELWQGLEARQAILNHDQKQIMLRNILGKEKGRVSVIGWKRFVAAAVILFVVCGLVWVASHRSQVPGSQSQVAVHDVPAPKGTRAVITLADGSKVYLDSAGNGTIAQQGNVSVVKNESGQIVYNGEGQGASGEMKYNTLSNPRGSKVIDMQLSDGSHVWLNAGSSVKYPVAFIGNERKVEITGEAYFEVKHNAKQPFKVRLPDGSIIEDIGTAFNVNAYSDEEDIKTTLIEGSVKVTGLKSQDTRVLKPGEQAVLSFDRLRTGSAQDDSQRTISVSKDVDVDEVMAWKNGRFVFNSADIQAIMRQIARWYDVDVVYEGQISQREFTGKINRNVNASEVMAMLEYAGVHFKIEGKKITVMP